MGGWANEGSAEGAGVTGGGGLGVAGPWEHIGTGVWARGREEGKRAQNRYLPGVGNLRADAPRWWKPLRSSWASRGLSGLSPEPGKGA